jgi:hypothetical protein
MVTLAGSLYLVSTAVFSVLAIVIGLRLIALSRRTQRGPERSLGLGFIGTAGLGYGLLMFAMLGKRAAGWNDAPAYYTWLIALGWIFHNLGVTFMLDFVHRVFRPEDGWARILKYTLNLVLWGGWLADAFTGGLTSNRPGLYYWIAFSVIGTYPLWTAVEAFRYWKLMRKRVALGLADPLVANRFLLWTIASTSTVASIWLVEVPTFLGYERMSAAAEKITSITMLCTSAFGIATICTYWLTFFPPAWYQDRFRVPAASETGS